MMQLSQRLKLSGTGTCSPGPEKFEKLRLDKAIFRTQLWSVPNSRIWTAKMLQKFALKLVLVCSFPTTTFFLDHISEILKLFILMKSCALFLIFT
jgi:hypothetical protein